MPAPQPRHNGGGRPPAGSGVQLLPPRQPMAAELRRQRAVNAVRRSAKILCFVGALLARLPHVGAEFLPGVLEMGVEIVPGKSHLVQVDVGQSKFFKFNCMGGPADVVLSLSSSVDHADPMLFLSLDPDRAPSVSDHHSSSFLQWREDSAGDQEVIAHGVGPRGGIIGLINMKHFAGEKLLGILSIRCAYIIAFDTLLWDYLKMGNVCPIGRISQEDVAEGGAFCGGNGECSEVGTCICDSAWTGPTCEHSKQDIVVLTEGKYELKVANGGYQYFRVRVPPHFPGGYLEVKAEFEHPLILLVRHQMPPTKGEFDISNFDDWVNQRTSSVLRLTVDPYRDAEGLPSAYFPSSFMHDRRLGGANMTWEDATDPAAFVRRLQQEDCPAAFTAPDLPACFAEGFTSCEANCMRCLSCVKGGVDDSEGGCTADCHNCMGEGCLLKLAQCAENLDCDGEVAQNCEAGCGSCMSCTDSNDHFCSGCGCCRSCLPVAAKCNILQKRPEHDDQWLFVGFFNHRRYSSSEPAINGKAEVSLTADPSYTGEIPSSWMAELYNRFRDISSLEVMQGNVEGHFFYTYEIRAAESMTLTVRLSRNRVTLLRFDYAPQKGNIGLEFLTGPKVTHLLVSTNMTPKTLFDFDQVPTQVGKKMAVQTNGKKTFWCALFGAERGSLRAQLTVVNRFSAARPTGMGRGTQPVAATKPYTGTFYLFFAVFGCCMLWVCCCGGRKQILDTLGFDVASLNQSRDYEHDNPGSDGSLLCMGSMRASSTTGYLGSDVIDRTVEEQYLHRGGIGDDGI